MAKITIDNLSVTGSELFSDSESYLDQLSEISETDALSIKGGTGNNPPTRPITTTWPTTWPTTTWTITIEESMMTTIVPD
ncbi:hypothetical protein [Microseira wollei]|uniref:Uncharacterized protein n=1 Tax=Microseira wollei NIES-4236 TaxID=2530354 RepID=A0AAV3X7F4_9CYAN|nr:hypothetical protein [Microseira wollei]GET36127.1 hypothetical protein MiSe_08750 [Microseira wollei NIES-4236]